MTGEERLAELYAWIRELEPSCLVMGGHAVRYYGVDRATIDYDMHLAVDESVWSGLGDRLRLSLRLKGLALVEGSSWRPLDFRRFVVGTLPDGREERLELWRRNHLLAPFDQLWARRSEGRYGGGDVAFLGIHDLIRSKETEREDDWRDVGLLEEIADEEGLAGAGDAVAALAQLRSRRGYERAARAGLLRGTQVVEAAAAQARNPITLAYLVPSAPHCVLPSEGEMPPPVRDLLSGPIRGTAPGSARHLALAEAVRRLYRANAMAADRADKERAAGARS